MSHPCDIANCRRISRALCHCCNQNLCRDHLNEHDDMLNSQLNPFADEVNQLSERLNCIDVRQLIAYDTEQLLCWREHSHRLVEDYFNYKQQELDEYVNKKIRQKIEDVQHLRGLVNECARKQDTTIDDLKSIASIITLLQKEITAMEQKSFRFNINPLHIDQRLIQLEEEQNTKIDFSLATLGPCLHTINRSEDSAKPLATNHRVTLIHHDNHLSLLNNDMKVVKSILWPSVWIWDMCWSSTLARFFIITRTDIFMLDETTMSLEQVTIGHELCLCSCSCSETSLYVTTNELASSIYEFSLKPTISIVNRWQPADLCQVDEKIQDMVFRRGTFGFILVNQTNHMKRLELRAAHTFEKLWTVQFNIVDPLDNLYRLCSFNYDEWLITDWKSSQLFHITNDGQVKSTCTYDRIPYRCCQIGSDLLAISTRNGVSLHKMKE
ncbi:unnamed protein product [Adineta ricciae]|uniref:Uncharacterized protein n=1 Tax=Adineta ricciae TaxID=249248 RepID=A0A815CBX9_ADIRI|nr:unnamed protein product [Adineta ricciae]